MASRRILIIDDSTDIAESLAELLQALGHETEVANDGPEGLDKSDSFEPDVVLCDINLTRDMTGYDVARKLRKRRGQNRPLLIAVTGLGKPDDKARCREAGFDHHLLKPISASQLAQVIGD